ncbi:MAG TPA: CBS domain-containing protein [Flavobacteriales bacterium]|nr:CBS domain-containing protein [Flavobacteriales bacterium]
MEPEDLLDRFLATFNQVEKALRKKLKAEGHASFTSLVDAYDRQRRLGRDVDFLKTVANLRNVLVHDKTEHKQHLAIPTLEVVKGLERVLERIEHPKRVVPAFQRKVEVVAPTHSLGEVLRRINAVDYSQFPVYEAGRFLGVLTENGITRWLAHHIEHTMSLVDLNEVPVRDVLQEEEQREVCRFIARDLTVDEARVHFADHRLLEVLLITQTGRKDQELLGIMTRWDLLQEQ